MTVYMKVINACGTSDGKIQKV